MSEFASSTQFLVLGDWGTTGQFFGLGRRNTNDITPKQAVAGQMVAAYKSHKEQPTASEFCVVTVGDNFYPSGVKSVQDEKWQTDFSDAYAGVDCDWYSCLGNHDWESNPKAQIKFKDDPRWHMDDHYYTKVINNVEFIFIDTVILCPVHTRSILGFWNKNCSLITEEAMEIQYIWLENALKASTADWIVVVGHYPIISGGSYREHDLKEMQRANALFKKYRIDAYLCGHDHSLQHIYNEETTQFHQFLSGTGAGSGAFGYRVSSIPSKTVFCQNTAGFLNVLVSNDVMNVKFVSDAGDVLHTVDIPKQDRSKVLGKRSPDETVAGTTTMQTSVSSENHMIFDCENAMAAVTGTEEEQQEFEEFKEWLDSHGITAENPVMHATANTTGTIATMDTTTAAGSIAADTTAAITTQAKDNSAEDFDETTDNNL